MKIVDTTTPSLPPEGKTLIELSRSVFISIALDKKNHSIVDKKNHYVLQVLSYKHWDKNTCSNTYELW